MPHIHPAEIKNMEQASTCNKKVSVITCCKQYVQERVINNEGKKTGFLYTICFYSLLSCCCFQVQHLSKILNIEIILVVNEHLKLYLPPEVNCSFSPFTLHEKEQHNSEAIIECTKTISEWFTAHVLKRLEFCLDCLIQPFHSN